MNIGYNKSHVKLLGNKALWYSSEENLTNILLNFDPKKNHKKTGMPTGIIPQKR